jgi:hypothetical protein
MHTQQIEGELLVTRLKLEKPGSGLSAGEKLKLYRRLGLRYDTEWHDESYLFSSQSLGIGGDQHDRFQCVVKLLRRVSFQRTPPPPVRRRESDPRRECFRDSLTQGG